MAAPTPVSALVHSSTLVTAGVFLLYQKFFKKSIFFNLFLLCISMTTLTISSISALGIFDLKKIIALSTLSQIGLILLSISLQNYSLAIFHILTHACFKSLLFIMAGYLLVLGFHNQDLRFLGKISPFQINIIIFICGFSLSGVFSLILFDRLFQKNFKIFYFNAIIFFKNMQFFFY